MKKAVLIIALIIGTIVQSHAQDALQPGVSPWGLFEGISAPSALTKKANPSYTLEAAIQSPNRTFSARHASAPAGLERTKIKGIAVYQGKKLLFRKDEMPGGSISLSNKGLSAVFDVSDDMPVQTITFYSPKGELLLSKSVKNSNVSGFSSTGSLFGIGHENGFELIDPLQKSSQHYDAPAWKFDVSGDETLLALAGEKTVSVYSGKRRIAAIAHDQFHIRAVKFSPDNKRIGFIGKNDLFVYSLPEGKLLFKNSIEEPLSFRDLMMQTDGLFTGIHCRDRQKNESRGILRRYTFDGKVQSEAIKSIHSYPPAQQNYLPKQSPSGSGKIGWPFLPQDKPCKAWNSYLLLSSSSDGNTAEAYLHQGLDMDVPSYAKTCSVIDGYVMAVLTIGGDIYWRVAVSPVRSADSSKGWLHAHLVQSSITVDVGDQVKVGDVLGEIIPWSGLPGGHIHFSHISSRGTTWSNWRNVSNPLLLLTPTDDVTAPEIQNAFSYSKFGFSTNDSVSTIRYLKPDSLKGSVDFLVKIRDICGASPWTQAATFINYWVKSMRTGETILPRKLGYSRNQNMPDYAGNTYNTLAPVMYRIDATFPVKGWFTKERLYVHIITNNNGDSVITVNEKNLAFNTRQYPDGTYRLFVEACDAAGHCTIDSQDVVFRNGNTSGEFISVKDAAKGMGLLSFLNVNQGVLIDFRLPAPAAASILIYSMTGQRIRTMGLKNPLPGRHAVLWNGTTESGEKAPRGTYVVRLVAGSLTSSAKAVFFRQ
jgi:murein DD-endopeptidase MepM/ murein hydrolase activator NlpD